MKKLFFNLSIYFISFFLDQYLLDTYKPVCNSNNITYNYNINNGNNNTINNFK